MHILNDGPVKNVNQNNKIQNLYKKREKKNSELKTTLHENVKREGDEFFTEFMHTVD